MFIKGKWNIGTILWKLELTQLRFLAKRWNGAMANMIITSECEQCVHSAVNEENKARVKVYCKVKDKVYYFGQCIPCEHKEMKKQAKMRWKKDEDEMEKGQRWDEKQAKMWWRKEMGIKRRKEIKKKEWCNEIFKQRKICKT